MQFPPEQFDSSSQWIEISSPPLEREAVGPANPLAAALDAAQKKGILHRDIR